MNSQKFTLNQVRNIFLDHMKENGHAIIPSSSLVPENDPTTLFTGSGMQPMLPYLLGQPHPLGKRIADSQKCFRSQDIEEVGDNRHTVFFEMLGNWSLGDFFKAGQIDIMWDFLINKIKLDKTKLYISCYEGNTSLDIPQDIETKNLWLAKGIEESRIYFYPDKKNWWSRSGVPENMPVGEPGGPDTEMFYDFDPSGVKKIHENSIYSSDVCHPNCDCGRFVEFGNNVFMQYKKTETGVEELTQKNVDFGGGLERIVAVLNDDADVFNIDAFDDAKKVLENISGQKYVSDLAVTFTDIKSPTFAYRVILDHVRAATFLIGDGVMPGNKDQMYFVRRLIRRAVRYARNLNINSNFTKEVATAFIDYYKNDYKDLEDKREIILSELDKEESKFRKTLEGGIKEFEKVIKNLNGKSLVSGVDAFNLLQSFGFPVELTQEFAKENNLEVDIQEFNKLKNEHAEASRTASAGKFKGGLGGDGEMEVKYHTATHMLHKALQLVLGETATQKGSNITPERLRFDFAFERKMTPEEIKKVEDIVNENIKKDLPMIRKEMSLDDAKKMGAMGLFGDKYGDVVCVYQLGSDESAFSLELCGGPHVENTHGMGTFKITKEEAVSQGVRRIKAVLE